MDDHTIQYDIFGSPACFSKVKPSRVNSLDLDRFIPSRRNLDLDTAHFKLGSPDVSQNDSSVFSPSACNSPGTPVYKRKMSTLSNGKSDEKILAFSPRCGNMGGNRGTDPVSNLRKRYDDLNYSTPRRKPQRYIPTSPDRILDMPDLRDDFYSNILDWNVHNELAVALTDRVYSWNVQSGTCSAVPLELPEETNITSLAWDPFGTYLAIGTDCGIVRVWHKEKDVVLEEPGELCDHYGTIHALDWMSCGKVLFSGQNCGCIHQMDIGTSNTSNFSRLGWKRGICGLKISPDEKYLATGGIDHCLVIWSITEKNIYQKIKAHSVTIKAIAWCPWQHNLVASGGGARDGHIRVWNINSGTKKGEASTNSQICSMLFSEECRELVTSHGVEHNDIVLWRFPQLEPVARLMGHSKRVLNIALSPDKKTLASCSADETLMLWKCFDNSGARGRELILREKLPCQSPLTRTIR